jgi:serine/threonine-protein kinase
MYAFGVLTYLMLTGVYPLDGDDYMAILMRQVHDEPRPPSSHRPELPSGVDAAIAWLMRKEPAARPDTLMAAVRMLEQAASSEMAAVAPPPDDSADSLSTLPIAAADPAPGTPSTLPSPGKRTPSVNRTPEGLPVAAVSEIRSAGGSPIATPSESQIPVLAAAESRASEARRWPAPPVLLAGGALLAAVVLVAVIFMRSRGQDPATAPAQAPPEAAASATSQPDAAAAAPPSAPDAVALPARPTDVFVTIEGAPPNTEVRRAGVLLGTAPGRVQLPRSDAESNLVFSADGYFSETLSVVPSADLTRTVKLRPRPSGSPPLQPSVLSGKPAAGSGKPAAGSAKPIEEPTNDIMPFPPVQQPPPSK